MKANDGGVNTATTADASPLEPNIYAPPAKLEIANDGNHVHSFVIGETGDGEAHNNMQPTLFLGNLFIFSGRINVQEC